MKFFPEDKGDDKNDTPRPQDPGFFEGFLDLIEEAARMFRPSRDWYDIAKEISRPPQGTGQQIVRDLGRVPRQEQNQISSDLNRLARVLSRPVIGEALKTEPAQFIFGKNISLSQETLDKITSGDQRIIEELRKGVGTTQTAVEARPSPTPKDDLKNFISSFKEIPDIVRNMREGIFRFVQSTKEIPNEIKANLKGLEYQIPPETQQLLRQVPRGRGDLSVGTIGVSPIPIKDLLEKFIPKSLLGGRPLSQEIPERGFAQRTSITTRPSIVRAEVATELMENLGQLAGGVPGQLKTITRERPTGGVGPTSVGTQTVTRPVREEKPSVQGEGPSPERRPSSTMIITRRAEVPRWPTARIPDEGPQSTTSAAKKLEEFPQAMEKVTKDLKTTTREIQKSIEISRGGGGFIGGGGLGFGGPPPTPPTPPRRPIVPGAPEGQTYATMFLREAVDPLVSAMWGAMFTVAWPMQTQLLRPFVEPVSQMTNLGDAMKDFIGTGTTGLEYMKKTFSAIMGESMIERYNLIRQTQVALESSIGQRASRAAISSALQMAREYPLMTREILQGIRTLAVYPQTKGLIAQPEFQKQLTEVVSGLAMINPMQGVGGALFSLIEAMSGSWRSLQMRFNVSPEVVASMAGMSREEMSSSPAKLIEGLNRFVTRALGPTAFEAQKYTLDKQVDNLNDAVDLLSRNIMEGSKAYDNLVKMAVVGQNTFAAVAQPGGALYKAIEGLVRPFSQNINLATAQFLGISPEAMSLLSPADLDRLTSARISQMSPDELVDRLGKAVGTFLGGVGDLQQGAGSLIGNFMQGIGPEVLPPLQKMVTSSMTMLFETAAKGATTVLTSKDFIQEVLPLYGGLFMGGRFLLGGLTALQGMMSIRGAGEEPLAASLVRTPGAWAAQRVIRPGVAAFGAGLFGLGPMGAIIPSVTRALGPAGELLSRSRFPLLQSIGNFLEPAATAFGYLPTEYQAQNRQLPRTVARQFRSVLARSLGNTLKDIYTEIEKYSSQLNLGRIARGPRGRLELTREQLQKMTPEMQELVQRYNQMTEFFPLLAKDNVTIGQSLDIIQSRRRALEGMIQNVLKELPEHPEAQRFGLRRVRFEGGVLVGAQGRENIIRELPTAYGKRFGALLDEYNQLSVAEREIQTVQQREARRMLLGEIGRGVGLVGLQLGAITAAQALAPGNLMMSLVAPTVATMVAEPLLSRQGLSVMSGLLRSVGNVYRIPEGPALRTRVLANLGLRAGVSAAMLGGGLAARDLLGIQQPSPLYYAGLAAMSIAPFLPGRRAPVAGMIAGAALMGGEALAARGGIEGFIGRGIQIGTLGYGAYKAFQFGRPLIPLAAGALAPMASAALPLLVAGTVLAGTGLLVQGTRASTGGMEERSKALQALETQYRDIGFGEAAPVEAQKLYSAVEKQYRERRGFFSSIVDKFRTSDEKEITRLAEEEFGKRAGWMQTISLRLRGLEETRTKFVEKGLGTEEIDKAISYYQSMLNRGVALLGGTPQKTGGAFEVRQQQTLQRLQDIRKQTGLGGIITSLTQKEQVLSTIEEQIRNEEKLAAKGGSEAPIHRDTAEALSRVKDIINKTGDIDLAFSEVTKSLISKPENYTEQLTNFYAGINRQLEVHTKTGKLRVVGLQGQDIATRSLAQVSASMDRISGIVRSSLIKDFQNISNSMILNENDVKRLVSTDEFKGREGELKDRLQKNLSNISIAYANAYLTSLTTTDNRAKADAEKLMGIIEQRTNLSQRQLLSMAGRSPDIQNYTRDVKELSNVLQHSLKIPGLPETTKQKIRDLQISLESGARISPDEIANVGDLIAPFDKELSDKIKNISKGTKEFKTTLEGGILRYLDDVEKNIQIVQRLGIAPKGFDAQALQRRISNLREDIKKGLIQPEDMIQEVSTIAKEVRPIKAFTTGEEMSTWVNQKFRGIQEMSGASALGVVPPETFGEIQKLTRSLTTRTLAATIGVEGQSGADVGKLLNAWTTNMGQLLIRTRALTRGALGGLGIGIGAAGTLGLGMATPIIQTLAGQTVQMRAGAIRSYMQLEEQLGRIQTPEAAILQAQAAAQRGILTQDIQSALLTPKSYIVGTTDLGKQFGVQLQDTAQSLPGLRPFLSQMVLGQFSPEIRTAFQAGQYDVAARAYGTTKSLLERIGLPKPLATALLSTATGLPPGTMEIFQTQSLLQKISTGGTAAKTSAIDVFSQMSDRPQVKTFAAGYKTGITTGVPSRIEIPKRVGVGQTSPLTSQTTPSVPESRPVSLSLSQLPRQEIEKIAEAICPPCPKEGTITPAAWGAQILPQGQLRVEKVAGATPTVAAPPAPVTSTGGVITPLTTQGVSAVQVGVTPGTPKVAGPPPTQVSPTAAALSPQLVQQTPSPAGPPETGPTPPETPKIAQDVEGPVSLREKTPQTSEDIMASSIAAAGAYNETLSEFRKAFFGGLSTEIKKNDLAPYWERISVDDLLRAPNRFDEFQKESSLSKLPDKMEESINRSLGSTFDRQRISPSPSTTGTQREKETVEEAPPTQVPTEASPVAELPQETIQTEIPQQNQLGLEAAQTPEINLGDLAGVFSGTGETSIQIPETLDLGGLLSQPQMSMIPETISAPQQEVIQQETVKEEVTPVISQPGEVPSEGQNIINNQQMSSIFSVPTPIGGTVGPLSDDEDIIYQVG